MSLLIGALIIGLILSLLALGVLVSFRIFSMPDITTDGSITLGASIAAILLVKGVNPILATAAGALGGAAAGAVTGIIHTKFNINSLLAGILGDDRALLGQPACHGAEQRAAHAGPHTRGYGENLGSGFRRGDRAISLGWPVASRCRRARGGLLVAGGWGGMYLFFRTNSAPQCAPPATILR